MTTHQLIGSTLRKRAMVAHALCAVAEQEWHSGDHGRTVETVRAIRMLLDDIDVLLSGDTSYLPYGTLREVSDLLAGLGERISAIESAMGKMFTIH